MIYRTTLDRITFRIQRHSLCSRRASSEKTASPFIQIFTEISRRRFSFKFSPATSRFIQRFSPSTIFTKTGRKKASSKRDSVQNLLQHAFRANIDFFFLRFGMVLFNFVRAEDAFSSGIDEAPVVRSVRRSSPLLLGWMHFLIDTHAKASTREYRVRRVVISA